MWIVDLVRVFRAPFSLLTCGEPPCCVQAGVSASQLENPETAEFIYKFLKEEEAKKKSQPAGRSAPTKPPAHGVSFFFVWFLPFWQKTGEVSALSSLLPLPPSFVSLVPTHPHPNAYTNAYTYTATAPRPIWLGGDRDHMITHRLSSRRRLLLLEGQARGAALPPQHR